jgi:drug/metabolite transporter (DMT)-like permease
LLFIKGVSLTTSIHASILSLVSPIFITAAAGWLLKEKFSIQKGIGLMLGITGAALIVSGRQNNSAPGANMLLGDILVIINAISYSIYFVLVKPLMEKYHPIHVVRWVFTFGAFLIFPFGIGDFLETDFSQFNMSAWLALALVVLGTTFLAYLLNVFGIKYLGAGITGMYIYTQPLFASFIGILFLNELFSLRLGIAAIMIGAGVLLVTLKRTN